jgi:hypothetical protein
MNRLLLLPVFVITLSVVFGMITGEILKSNRINAINATKEETALSVCRALVGAFASAEIENGMTFDCSYQDGRLILTTGLAQYVIENGQMYQINH